MRRRQKQERSNQFGNNDQKTGRKIQISEQCLKNPDLRRRKIRKLKQYLTENSIILEEKFLEILTEQMVENSRRVAENYRTPEVKLTETDSEFQTTVKKVISNFFLLQKQITEDSHAWEEKLTENSITMEDKIMQNS